MNKVLIGDDTVLGVYISGYHITTLIVDLHSGAVLKPSYQRKPINSRGAAADIIDECAQVIQHALTSNGTDIKKIGIAMPGPFDYQQGVSYIKNNKKHASLYGINVKQLLADKLGIATTAICMLNDAAAFLKGEVFAGVAKGHQRVIGITIGTGLGTARLSGGHAEDADLWQSPFLDSIAEDYISERWLLKRYYDLSGINVLNIQELAALHQKSTTVKTVFKEFADNLSLFTANFIRADHPEMVVISGNIAETAASYFMPHFKTQLIQLAADVPVITSKLNSDAVLIGAATCWMD